MSVSSGFSSWAKDSSSLLPGGLCKVTGRVFGRKFMVLAFSMLSVWNFAMFPKTEISVLLSQVRTSRLLLGWGWGSHPAVWGWAGGGGAAIWGSSSFGRSYLAWTPPQGYLTQLIPHFWGAFHGESGSFFALNNSALVFSLFSLQSKSPLVHLLSRSWHQYPVDGYLGHFYSLAITSNAETEILVYMLFKKKIYR